MAGQRFPISFSPGNRVLMTALAIPPSQAWVDVDDDVRMSLDPPGRGRTLGIPLRLRELMVSVEERDLLLASLASVRP
jgi:hypothetical protein